MGGVSGVMRHQCVQFSRAFLTCTCRALARCCCCRRNAAVAMFVASVSNLQLWVVVIVGIFFHVYVTSVRGDAASSMRLLLRQLADCCSCGGLSHFFHFTFLSLPVSFVSLSMQRGYNADGRDHVLRASNGLLRAFRQERDNPYHSS